MSGNWNCLSNRRNSRSTWGFGCPRRLCQSSARSRAVCVISVTDRGVSVDGEYVSSHSDGSTLLSFGDIMSTSVVVGTGGSSSAKALSMGGTDDTP